MRKNKVTLIIGAGASKSINESIDTGPELVQNIADRVIDKRTTDKYLSNLLNDDLGIPRLRTEDFSRRLYEYIEKKGKSQSSIDEFANLTSDIEGFTDLAHFSIVFHVMGFEGKDTIRLIDSPTWLAILKKFIDTNILRNQPLVDLRIVTFNYDRIVEYFLLRSYGDDRRIIDFIDSNILHVYGRIGALPLLKIGAKEAVVPFDLGNNRARFMFENRYSIELMHSKRENMDHLKNIPEIIHDSDKLIFLGYGFHELNNVRIGLSEYIKAETHINIYHTTSQLKIVALKIIPNAKIYVGEAYPFLHSCLE